MFEPGDNHNNKNSSVVATCIIKTETRKCIQKKNKINIKKDSATRVQIAFFEFCRRFFNLEKLRSHICSHVTLKFDMQCEFQMRYKKQLRMIIRSYSYSEYCIFFPLLMTVTKETQCNTRIGKPTWYKNNKAFVGYCFCCSLRYNNNALI